MHVYAVLASAAAPAPCISLVRAQNIKCVFAMPFVCALCSLPLSMCTLRTEYIRIFIIIGKILAECENVSCMVFCVHVLTAVTDDDGGGGVVVVVAVAATTHFDWCCCCCCRCLNHPNKHLHRFLWHIDNNNDRPIDRPTMATTTTTTIQPLSQSIHMQPTHQRRQHQNISFESHTDKRIHSELRGREMRPSTEKALKKCFPSIFLRHNSFLSLCLIRSYALHARQCLYVHVYRKQYEKVL